MSRSINSQRESENVQTKSPFTFRTRCNLQLLTGLACNQEYASVLMDAIELQDKMMNPDNLMVGCGEKMYADLYLNKSNDFKMLTILQNNSTLDLHIPVPSCKVYL